MRDSITNGNGATCDLCDKPLKPFDVYRLIGQTTIPGKNYKKVTSDTTTKTHNKYHLCQTCYNKVITAIDLKSI